METNKGEWNVRFDTACTDLCTPQERCPFHWGPQCNKRDSNGFVYSGTRVSFPHPKQVPGWNMPYLKRKCHLVCSQNDGPENVKARLELDAPMDVRKMHTQSRFDGFDQRQDMAVFLMHQKGMVQKVQCSDRGRGTRGSAVALLDERVPGRTIGRMQEGAAFHKRRLSINWYRRVLCMGIRAFYRYEAN